MKRTLAGIACCVALSACAPTVPESRAFPPSEQQVVTSASHWQAVAEDFATALAPAAGRFPYVSMPIPATSFSAAFGQMLSTALSERGAAVTVGFMGPTWVRYDAQVVRHGATAVGMPSAPRDVRAVAPTEIVVTGAVVRGGVDVARVTRVYYVADADVADYLPPSRPIVLVRPPSVAASLPSVRPSLVAVPMLVMDRYGEKTVLVGSR